MSWIIFVELLLEGVKVLCYMRGLRTCVGKYRGSRKLVAAAFLILWLLECFLVAVFPGGRASEAMLCDLFFWLVEMPVLLVLSIGYRGGILRHLLAALFLPAIYWMGKWLLVLAMFSGTDILEREYTIATGLVVLLLGAFVLVLEKLQRSRQELEHQMLQQEVKAYEHQFEVIRQSQEQIRALKHDMKHHIKMLTDLTAAGDREGTLAYLANMGEFMENSQEYVASGNEHLDGILNYMIARGKGAGIRMEWKVQVPKNLKVAAFDLNVILGNLFENAFAALEQVPDPALSVLVKYDRGVLCISTRNVCSAADAGQQDGEEHGYGLKNVSRIAEKYHGSLVTACRQGEFLADVLLYLEN